ncbi:MAG: hypothetical protein D6791_01185 [Chloroflexi bacterium]|nr:MAG: hypothetical protein D6791_01185 [Chloroflexota bacterium]
MHAFDYVKPNSLEQVGELLAQAQEDVRILAGGTELLLQIERGEVKPALVLDIKGLPDLDFVRFDYEQGLTIGATTTVTDLMRNHDVRKHYPLLAQACSIMATEQIRNRATVGGNVCSGFVFSDFAPVLMCYDAVCHLWGPRGQRAMRIEDFCREGARLSLAQDELLVSVQVPTPWAESWGDYQKLRPGQGAHFALAAAAVFACRVEETLTDWRVAVTAVAPYPQRLPEVEKLLDDGQMTEALLQHVAERVSETVAPVPDPRAGITYRKAMAGIMVARGVQNVTAYLLGGRH